MPRELAAPPERADASGPVETVNAASAGESVPAVVAAEATEAAEAIDAAEQRLIDAFGPVTRWWTGELPGLGVMRLPLP